MASSKSKPSIDLLQRLHERLSRHVQPGQRVCVALSGGIDSVVLLHAASRVATLLKASLAALHVNHGLSPHAGDWEAFCVRLCRRFDIPFVLRRVEVEPQGKGVEAAARAKRYDALESFESDWFLLGHHQDDQAETLLLNLLRGAGVYGAAGMAERHGRLLRPLLDIPRAEIAAYASLHNLDWVEDDSNIDTGFSRNFLRHRVMPVLEQAFPAASVNLARAATSFGEASELLDDLARIDLADVRFLEVARLRALSPVRGANLLAYCLHREGVQIPSRALLLEMLRQLIEAGDDSEICFKVGNHEIHRFQGRVWIEHPTIPVQPTSWLGEGEVDWGGHVIRSNPCQGTGIDRGMLQGQSLRFTPRKEGDSMQLRENGPRRPLKDLLREAGVPPWRRGTLPALYAGDEIVWMAGIGIDVKYRCKPGADGVLIEFDGVTW